METKHTPGPWMVYGETQGPRKDMIISTSNKYAHDFRHIARLFSCDAAEPTMSLCAPLRAEAEANARIISAAPELLEACKRLLACANAYSDAMKEHGKGHYELGEDAASYSIAGMARAAIAKAEAAQ